MATVALDKGIPIPNDGLGRKATYPWRDMEVGDSFLIADKKIGTVSGWVSREGKLRGQKYTCRTVEGGVRVWRVA